MSDYTDHMHEERNAQRALVLALAYPLGLLLLVVALFVWGAA
jgi:type II secretory pathway component PulF